MPAKKLLTFSLLLSLVAVASLLQGCKKDDDGTTEDFRDAYTGQYEFTVASYYWTINTPTSYDTNVYVGTITKFVPGDVEIDTLIFNNKGEEISNRITIKYAPNLAIAPVLNEDGTFVRESEVTFNREGAFQDPNTLEFIVATKAGQGSAQGAYITAVRK